MNAKYQGIDENIPRNILSDITTYMKYSKFVPDKKRRETWDELVDRNLAMHIAKFPEMKEEITQVYEEFVRTKKVLASMRSFQFAGKPIELNASRIYNCSFAPVDSIEVFSEIMFLLLGGTGVGFSVQTNHVDKLPALLGTLPLEGKERARRFLVGDSIEGWADAIKVLLSSWFKGKKPWEFDFRDIRPKGAHLVTSGGKAPGAGPLRECITQITNILERAVQTRGRGTKLTPLEAHDIVCHIADAVLAGGIRRAALISLFSYNDEEMISCKSGNWWETNPQRGRANNSVVLMRDKLEKTDFLNLWKKIEASGAGEPGIYLSNDEDWGTNPCCFTGDTQILTNAGYREISNLANGHTYDFINYVGDVVKGTAWSTGEKEVFLIKSGNTSNPTQIKATADHKFLTIDGRTVETRNIKGERLMPFYTIKEITPNLATKYGFVFGDGSFRKNSEKFTNIQVSFTPVKDDEVKALFERTGWSKDETSFTVDVSFEELEAFNISTSRKTYERVLPSMNQESALDFLTGLYSANGSVIKGSRVAYKTTSPEVRDGLLKWLRTIGIGSAYVTTNRAKLVSWSNGQYESRESYDINISNREDIILFAKLIGFIQSYKRADLENLILSKAPYVYGVDAIGVEEVYDFNLQDDTHWGVVEGIIAHNCEIALRPFQMCNLTEINATTVVDQEDLNARARAGAFLGTLQASYTDFHYLRPIWQKTVEKDALLGVSMTGIASPVVLSLNLEESAREAVKENVRVAKLLGINPASRVTAVKPSGTTSLVLGTSSGIHAWHNDYYIRRIRVGKNEAIYKYLATFHPELVEDEYFRPKEMAVISVPQKAPEGAILRTESPLETLERVKLFSKKWVKPGHVKGKNTHNVSCTISIKDDEWPSVGEWMWENRGVYNGISVLNYNGGTYQQAPFEDITQEKYEEMLKHLMDIDLSLIVEENDDTDLKGEIACGPQGCDVV